MKVSYEKIEPISRGEAEMALQGVDPEKTVLALLSLAHYDLDWQWVQERCLNSLGSSLPDVRMAAITCLGHLARIHRQIDRDRVLPALNHLRSNPDLVGKIDDAIEDIELFTGDAA